MQERKFTLMQWRKIAGLSRNELAEAVNKDPTTIWNWETGKTNPNATDIANLEHVLNINWSQDILMP